MKPHWMGKIIVLPLLLWASGVTAAPTGLSYQPSAASSVVSATSTAPHDSNRPTILPPAGSPYRSLKMASANDGWIVGEGGLIKRYMAGQWLDYPSPVTTTLNAVAANSTDAWAVGAGNTILHLVGNNWQPVASPILTDTNLVDVDIVAPSEVWIIGSPAVMLHYSAGSWSLGPTPPAVGPISWGSPSDAWLVNRTYTAYHYAAGSWTATTLYDYGAQFTATADSVLMLSPDLGWIGTYSVSMDASIVAEYMQYTSANGWRPWPPGRLCVTQSGCTAPSSAQPANRPAAPNCVNNYTDIYNLVAFTATEFYAASDQLIDDCGSTSANYYLWQNQVGSNQSDIELGQTYTHTFALSGSSGNDLWMLGNNTVRHWDGTSITVAPNCANPYTDVPASYYAISQIEYLTCHGIVAGTGNNTFSPNASASRIQFAKMISLARSWPLLTPGSGQTFTDVPPSNPLYAYVETAYQNGAISGATQATCSLRQVLYPCFLPNDPISRAQTAVITVRAFSWAIDTSGGPHFSDVPATNYAYGAVETCYNRGVVNGIGGGLFAPNANVTRAQLAIILYGALTLP